MSPLPTLSQSRKAKRESEAAREEASELTQRLAARDGRTAELETRAAEAHQAAEAHCAKLAGALAAVRARESEAAQKLASAERRLQQAVARDEKHIEVCFRIRRC